MQGLGREMGPKTEVARLGARASMGAESKRRGACPAVDRHRHVGSVSSRADISMTMCDVQDKQ